MIDLKLRGYVTPEDFEGSDRERIQKALDYADEEDIRKVVLSGEYNADLAITIPCGIHLVFDNASLRGDLKNQVINNFSFETDRIYIEGKNSEITGNLTFCHARHVVLENITINGDVSFEFSRDLRIEYVKITKQLAINRGCQNTIIQHIECDNVLMSGESKGCDIIGREPIIKNILLRDGVIKNGALLKAGVDCGFLNIQLEDIHSETTCVTVGTKDEKLPKEQYQNFTFINLNGPEKVIFNNDYKYAYLGFESVGKI